MTQIKRTGLIAVAAMLAATVLYAQPKPVGAYSPEGAPAWVTFGTIPSWADDAAVRRAVAQSAATGFKWIVQFGFDVSADTSVSAVAPAQKARLERLGLWPHVVAVDWSEEWYERCLGGEFFERFHIPAGSPLCGPAIESWLGAQHASLKRITGKPVIWVTGMVVPGRLVPANTDYVAVDYYPQDGQPIEAIAPVVLAAEQHTTLPLIIVARWFRNTGPYQGPSWNSGDEEPPASWADGYATVLARPRWFAMIGFLWNSRPWAELVGLADMPTFQAAVKRSLGVQ